MNTASGTESGAKLGKMTTGGPCPRALHALRPAVELRVSRIMDPSRVQLSTQVPESLEFDSEFHEFVQY